jgi:hypothetical protein
VRVRDLVLKVVPLTLVDPVDPTIDGDDEEEEEEKVAFSLIHDVQREIEITRLMSAMDDGFVRCHGSVVGVQETYISSDVDDDTRSGRFSFTGRSSFVESIRMSCSMHGIRSKMLVDRKAFDQVSLARRSGRYPRYLLNAYIYVSSTQVNFPMINSTP